MIIKVHSLLNNLNSTITSKSIQTVPNLDVQNFIHIVKFSCKNLLPGFKGRLYNFGVFDEEISSYIIAKCFSKYSKKFSYLSKTKTTRT